MPTICANGVDLYYETQGAGDPVLLVHGLGSSTLDWESQVAALTPRFKVIAFDVRGHGRSAKPRHRYSVRLFSEDMAALVRALHVGPVHVVGISMGGMIAFQLAVTAPELVRSLTIVNSGPAMPVRTLAQWMMIWTRIAIVRLRGMRKMGADQDYTPGGIQAGVHGDHPRGGVSRDRGQSPHAADRTTRAVQRSAPGVSLEMFGTPHSGAVDRDAWMSRQYRCSKTAAGRARSFVPF